MATASDLLAVARGELGIKESPANSNRVKYNTAYYGREVSGSAYPWCAAFVWWCCQQAGVALPIKTASCSALRTAARSVNMWVTGGYKPGDIVIYDWDGDGVAEHCGIVESVDGSVVTAIEGNTSTGNDSDGGEVMRRYRSTSFILGAVRPAYEEEETMDNAPSPAHEEGVEWAVENGILKGNDGDLMLSQPVTRQQMCTMLKRLYDFVKSEQ